MKRHVLLAALVILLLLTACQAAPAAIAPEMGVKDMDRAAVSEEFAPAPAPPYEVALHEGQAAQTSERVVIKNASLEIIVADPISSVDAISRMAEEMGGFVVNSSTFRTRTARGVEVPEGFITVRVPAIRLTEAMDRIKALVADPDEDVLNEHITGQDITLEYTDLQSRLKNQEDAAEALRKILVEARRTEDVLLVHQELNRVTEQIELLKGQIRYFDESVRLSAISVRVQSEEAIAPITVAGWTPGGVARDALQALIDALRILVNASIWLVVFCLPLGVLVLIPGFFIYRGLRSYRKRKQAANKSS